MPELFKPLDESSLKNNFQAFTTAKLLNTGIYILNNFLDYKLGQQADVINEFTPKDNQEDSRTLQQLHETVKFQRYRADIEARKLALNYYLQGKTKNKDFMRIDNPFAFFRAHELIAIADMLEIVIEKVATDINRLSNTNEKQALNAKLDELKQARHHIIPCMKKHVELAYHNAQQRMQDSDLGISFQDVRSNNEVSHSLITLSGLVPDCSLGNTELTKHPMRKEFKAQNHATHTPNQLFLFSYVYQHGSAEDKQWVTTHDNGLSKYNDSLLNKFWKSLPTTTFSVFSHHVVPTLEAAPALHTSQSEPSLHHSNLNTSWMNIPRSASEPTKLLVKTEQQEFQEKVNKAQTKYDKYYPAFVEFRFSMTGYLTKIKKAQGLGAYRSDGFIDFVKNAFHTRKIQTHEKRINDIIALIFTDKFVEFNKNTDQEKIQIMEEIDKKFISRIKWHIDAIQLAQYSFPSELEKILNNALTNPEFPWNKKDDSKQAIAKLQNKDQGLESDWEQIEMTSGKSLLNGK